MASTLPRRIAVAALGIPLAAGLIFLGGWWLVAAVTVLAVVGTTEFFRFARATGSVPLRWPGLAGAVVLPPVVFATVVGTLSLGWVVAGGVTWVIGTMAYATATSAPDRAPVASIPISLFGPVYASGLLSALLVLRHGFPELSRMGATGLVFLPVVTTWLCDTAAMTGGSLFGGPKWVPRLSPGKTWSGMVSGLVVAIVVAAVYGRLLLPRLGVDLAVGPLLVIGVVVGILGQVGDLAESLFKRAAGVKDSGAFFGAHGGVLDRLDSLYWVLPLSAIVVMAWGGI